MNALMVQIDGATIPLADCFWVLADPTGCAYASSHGDTAVNEEDAHQRFTTRQRDRDRQTRQGYTVQLLTKDQWRTQAGPCFYGTCQHRKAVAS